MTPDQPRHPLAPEDRIALIQPHLPEEVTLEVETGDHQDAWVSANTTRHTLLNLEGDVDEAGTDILWHVIESQARAIAALRAQAEAEAAWKARMNHACLRLDMRARSAASVGHARQAEIWTAAGDIVSEEYRAALAQAGGES